MVEILFADNHLLLLNKPAGLLTQTNGTDDPSLEAFGKEWIKKEYQKQGNVFLAAVHRLDRPVSGIVLFARTSKALSRLNHAQRQGIFQKEYIALVEGFFGEDEGILEHYLQKEEFLSRVVSQANHHAKKCLLRYQVISKHHDYSLLKISLMTGRYHQIRAQLSACGHPILGDQKYGSSFISQNLFLHHSSLSFPHPITQENLRYEISPPHNWLIRPLA